VSGYRFQRLDTTQQDALTLDCVASMLRRDERKETRIVTSGAGRSGMSIGGKYRLGVLLGKGGMGAVYAAENILTGKRVAIKCMNVGPTGGSEAAARFMREAKASARVRHPNVVDVYDVLAEDDQLFLIMELLEGEPLSAFLAKESIPLPSLIRLLIPAMRGVAAAHRQGVVHRDVKPENIFLAKEGDDGMWVPKVLDFGISKLQGTQEIALTEPGDLLGTLLYMATEQLDGASEVDARADVYALGVILYQAITGQFPFYADTVPALVMQIFTAEPTPIRQLRGDVPMELAEVIARAMAKQRTQRFQNMEELISALVPFADEGKYGRYVTRVSSKPLLERPNLLEELSRPQPTAETERGSSILSRPPTTETPFSANLRAEPPASAGWFRAAAAVGGVLVLAAVVWYWVQERVEPQRSVQAATVAPVVQRPGGLRDAGQDPAVIPRGTATPAEPKRENPKPATITEKPPTAAPAPPVRDPRPAPVAGPAKREGVSPAERPGCNPNFFFDAKGNKHFKRECF